MGSFSAPSQNIKDAVWVVIASRSGALAANFYDTFLQNTEASRYLKHEEVHTRLQTAMGSWLLELFDATTDNIKQAEQRRIGMIHARIGVPIHLVLRGATSLKEGIARDLIADLSGMDILIESILFVNGRIDTAMEMMIEGSFARSEREAKAAESYRRGVMDHDLMSEKEVQRSALLKWCQAYFMSVIIASSRPPSLKQSGFGLWLRYKGRILFEGASGLVPLIAAVEAIENLLASENESDTGVEIALRIQAAVDEAEFLLDDLFQALIDLEHGTDPLTKALNRRFIPTILGRQLEGAAVEKNALSVIMLDIDHFKKLNDEYGHSSGDIVLQQVSARIYDNIRPYDFLFRYGGEEFLVVLPDATGPAALEIAKRLQECIAGKPFHIFDKSEIIVTISLGVAIYDGHPDYEFLINAADQALYRAKRKGRNQIGVSSSSIEL